MHVFRTRQIGFHYRFQSNQEYVTHETNYIFNSGCWWTNTSTNGLTNKWLYIIIIYYITNTCMVFFLLWYYRRNRAFRLVVQTSFVFANSKGDWLTQITWFLLVNNSCCLQKQMKIKLQVERFHWKRLYWYLPHMIQSPLSFWIFVVNIIRLGHCLLVIFFI